MKRKQKSKKLRQKIAPKLGVMIVLGILLMSMVGAGIFTYYYTANITGEVYSKLLYNGQPMEMYDEQISILGFEGEFGNVSNSTIHLNANYTGYVDINVNITTDEGLIINWASDGYHDENTMRIYPDQTVHFATTYEFGEHITCGLYNATITLT